MLKNVDRVFFRCSYRTPFDDCCTNNKSYYYYFFQEGWISNTCWIVWSSVSPIKKTNSLFELSWAFEFKRKIDDETLNGHLGKFHQIIKFISNVKWKSIDIVNVVMLIRSKTCYSLTWSIYCSQYIWASIQSIKYTTSTAQFQ